MGLFDFFTKKGGNKKNEKELDVVDKRKAKCPNCEEKLSSTPDRKRKCPYCEKYLYVRTTPIERTRLVVTKKEKEEIDFNKTLFDQLLPDKGISKKEAESLFKENNFQSPRDVAWSLCNKKILEHKKKGDYQGLQGVYLVMEKILAHEEKDWIKTAKERLYFQAKEQKEEGLDFVIPTAALDNQDKLCDTCNILEGSKIDIEKAINDKPVPPEDCACEYRYWTY